VPVTGHPDLKICPFWNGLLSYSVIRQSYIQIKKAHVITGASDSSFPFRGCYMNHTCDNTADSLPPLAPKNLSDESELTDSAFYSFLSPGKS